MPVAVLAEAVTTPDELMLIPETVAESELRAICQVQDEEDPVPPLIEGVEVLAVPKVVDIPG